MLYKKVDFICVLRKSEDSINVCIKNSTLFHSGIIEQRHLSINERVRRFGGHKTYSTFLMYLGMGLLRTKRKRLNFISSIRDFIALPRILDDHEIVKDYPDRSTFVDDIFPSIGTSKSILQSVILTPTNEVIYQLFPFIQFF